MRNFTNDIKLSAPIPSLGLAQGDSLQYALEVIAELLTKHDKTLEQELYPQQRDLTTDDIKYTGDGFAPTGLSPEAQAIEDVAKIKIETVKGENDVELKFDVTGFDLPEGAAIASTIFNVAGQLSMGRTEIANTKQPAGTINIAYARFPVTVDARVVVAIPDKGDVELRKTMTLTSDNEIAEETPFQVTDRTTQKKPTNLTEIFTQMNSRIKYTERKK